MTNEETNQKCREIVEAIRDRANALAARGTEGVAVGFSDDWGGNSLTVHDGELGHSHVGGIFDEEDTFENLVEQLHDLLIHRRGLSFENPPGQDQ